MATCFDNLHSCVWFEGGERRNTIASMLAGFLFFTGWWFVIDASFTHPDSIKGAYHVCGIIGTISLFMINTVSNAQIRGDALFSGGCCGPRGTRAWLFFGFVLGFASVFASCWVFFADFLEKSYWAGAALFLQNLFIFAGSLCYKFGRVEDQWG
ncbi:hypothetical protein LSTR_LSTR003138 [Laodelphax striatellus]|uniref:Transmembrane protein 50A n=1 Tax=Laodelphax striatellus TaxID=195883 RepID=A0A482WVV5_LAOST|nr:hypothetical protein LSTR_LSTR003138 [Laodelphax striatellus]